MLRTVIWFVVVAALGVAFCWVSIAGLERVGLLLLDPAASMAVPAHFLYAVMSYNCGRTRGFKRFQFFTLAFVLWLLASWASSLAIYHGLMAPPEQARHFLCHLAKRWAGGDVIWTGAIVTGFGMLFCGVPLAAVGCFCGFNPWPHETDDRGNAVADLKYVKPVPAIHHIRETSRAVAEEEASATVEDQSSATNGEPEREFDHSVGVLPDLIGGPWRVRVPFLDFRGRDAATGQRRSRAPPWRDFPCRVAIDRDHTHFAMGDVWSCQQTAGFERGTCSSRLVFRSNFGSALAN